MLRMDEHNAPEQTNAIVGWLTPDGQLHLIDCEVCPYRGQLCETCCVPDIEAGMSEPEDARTHDA